MKRDDIVLGILLGAVFIGIPVLIILVSRQQWYPAPLAAPPAGSYQNDEVWEMKFDSKDMPIGMVVHRNAERR